MSAEREQTEKAADRIRDELFVTLRELDRRREEALDVRHQLVYHQREVEWVAAGLGVLLIALMKNARQAGPVLGGALTALGMLGGLFTAAVPNIPAAFQTLSNFTPHGWVMQGWRLALAGQPASAVLLPFAVATAMGLAMFAIGAVLFQRRLA